MTEVEKERRFPVMRGTRHLKLWIWCGVPTSIPWVLIAQHARQAERNHSQTLEGLASRGGLDPSELLAVLQDKPYPAGPPADPMGVWNQLRPLLEPDRSESGP